ncbi:ribonuclease H-like domain-containing protein [Tanacetum coccineum]|uniref:Ribonuclease H-like domain-containing protein n=1 Tax=Tanacetum coccineum TaxID=301880 RepID=A0ABQ5FJU2_9ASTR
MSASQDEIPPPPPPPPSSSQTPTQQTPQNSSTIQSANSSKGRILNLAMKMEHYLWPIHTIQSGGYTKWNGPVSITTDTSGQIKVLPPRTAEEIVARERERKARTTLLMALPEDHLAKFHKMTDAKEVVGMPVKSRFGENDESKKDSKFQSLLSQLEIHGAGVSTEDANKKFLRSLPSAWSQVSLIMRTKPGVDSLSFDDLYNNLRVFESDIKGSTASSSSPQNVAFVSENSSNTNEVSTGLIGLTFRRWRRLSFDGLHSSRLRHRGNFMFLDKCKESNAKSKKLYDAQREQLSDASIEIKAYSQGLKQGCQDRDPTWDRFCLCKIEIIRSDRDRKILPIYHILHITGNKAYLAEFQDFNDGPVAFGGSKGYITGKGGLACLIAKATTDESNKWHRRLGHVNFKNLNKLVKGNLVRGLPSKLFQNDHTCVACQKGKQHKASCKAKTVSSISHSLQLLHMDLFGPTTLRSLNPIENQLNQKVKTIRSDNGTEFKNRDVIEFCGLKGIKREYSNARTPQQNGVAERKNRTLIEAARTKLANLFLT